MSASKRLRLLVLLTFMAVFSLLVAPTVQAKTHKLGVTVSIPSVHIKASVVEVELRQFKDGSVTWDMSSVKSTVGHLQGTSWLDNPGNIVLAGHSELARRKPGIFARLDRVQVGDSIFLTNANDQWHYVVSETRVVNSDDLSVLVPTSGDQLTLITCYIASYNRKTGDYDKRLIVIAQRVND